MSHGKQKCLLLGLGLLVSAPSSAFTVYQDDTTKADIQGAFVLDYWEPTHDSGELFDTSRSKLAFSVERQLRSGWVADMFVEWDNMTHAPSNDDGKFRNRYAYVTLAHEDFGSFRAGKQNSAYHDVAGYMNNLMVFDPDATPIYSEFGDGGFLATGRGDNLIVYRNNIENFNFSAQYGFDGVENRYHTLERDKNYAVALSYDFDFGLSFGATYLSNEVKAAAITGTGLEDGDKQEIVTVAAQYSYEGFMAAVSYTDGKKAHETNLFRYNDSVNNRYADATGIDFYAEYSFNCGARPYVYISNVSFDDASVSADGDREIYSFGLSYHFDDKMVISGEVRETKEDNIGNGKQSDTLTGFNLVYVF